MKSSSLFDVAHSQVQLFKKWPELGVQIDMKREDLLHPQVSGNKLRKLKYNLLNAQADGLRRVATFGGAYSNHIAATAAAAQILGLKSVGIIRGDELAIDVSKTLSHNPTLSFAHSCGMELRFVSREVYRQKQHSSFKAQLFAHYGNDLYIIPEGGTNEQAIKGTAEILTQNEKQTYSIIAVAGGTGGTAAGIIESSLPGQEVWVYSALKGDFLKEEISKFTQRTNFKVFSEDRFGGYAKFNAALVAYMNQGYRETGIPLDPVYTSKMMYALEQQVESGVISRETRILAIHTGGLQGIAGFNKRLAQKGMQTIDYEA